jgi:quercetin 2,3-dioxygenase
MHFGKLRVLNDDIVAPGKGFGLHLHENMEIVTIPLEGRLAHTDSTGYEQTIAPNEVQVMSAGTGIWHSEHNHSQDENVRLLQIWVLPDEKGHEPRYDQKSYNAAQRQGRFQTLVAPGGGDVLSLNQQVVFSRIDLADQSAEYRLRNSVHGVYVFVISGEVAANDIQLEMRDGLGVWDVDAVTLASSSAAEILLIEIPMR